MRANSSKPIPEITLPELSQSLRCFLLTGSRGRPISSEEHAEIDSPMSSSKSLSLHADPILNDSNPAEPGTSTDIERQTLSLEDPPDFHTTSPDPNPPLDMIRDYSHPPVLSTLENLRISGTETETVCNTSPPVEVIDVNEGELLLFLLAFNHLNRSSIFIAHVGVIRGFL